MVPLLNNAPNLEAVGYKKKVADADVHRGLLRLENPQTVRCLLTVFCEKRVFCEEDDFVLPIDDAKAVARSFERRFQAEQTE